MVEIGSAYADFAINSQPIYRPRYHGARRGPLHMRLGAAAQFALSLLTNVVLLLPIVLFLLWRDPRHSLGRIPLADVSPLNLGGAMTQALLMVLVGRAVAWYGQAERRLTSVRARNDLKLRQANLLHRFNNPLGAAALYRQVEADPREPAGSYRRASLERELARSDLAFGRMESALARLEQALNTFRRYGDRQAEAEVLALLGHARLLQTGPSSALDAYRASIERFRQMGDRLGLGRLVLEIEELQGRGDIPGPREVRRGLVDALGIDEAERVYFSRPSQVPATLLTAYLAGPVLLLLGLPLCLLVSTFVFLSGLWPLVMLLWLVLAPMSAWMGLTAVLVAAPGHVLRLLEAQRPGLVLPSAEGLAWVGLDGRVEHSVRWDEVSGVRSREVTVFGTLQRVQSGLTLYAGEGVALHISGYTTDFGRLRDVIWRRLSARPAGMVAWQVQHIHYGLTRAPLSALARLVAWAIFSFVALIWGMTSLSGAAAPNLGLALATLALAAGGAAVNVWGLAWLAREQASHPRWPLAELLLGNGLVYMGSLFVPPWRYAVGGWVLLMLFALGLGWVLLAGAWMLRPRYLVKKPNLPRWMALRRHPLLAAGLMALCLLLALRVALVEARGYFHLGLGQTGTGFGASTEYRLRQFGHAARLVPDEPGAHVGLYIAHLELGDHVSAEAVLPQVMEALRRSRSEPLSEKVCWEGALAGGGAGVLPACDLSVELNPYAVWVVGQRAVARALTGDLVGAAADLRYIPARFAHVVEPERIKLYETWAVALESGRNPFDEATLAEISQIGWSWYEPAEASEAAPTATPVAWSPAQSLP
jgi:hypothetical protein